MFESSLNMALTDWAEDTRKIDEMYYKCWEKIKKNFNPLVKEIKMTNGKDHNFH